MKTWIKKVAPYFLGIGFFGAISNLNPNYIEQKVALIISIIFLIIGSILLCFKN